MITYKLKENIDITELLKDGFKYGSNKNTLYKSVFLKEDIILFLSIEIDVMQMNIEVLDDEFGQPYFPLYKYYNGEKIKPFPFLNEVIKRYEVEMDSIRNLYC